MTDHDLDRILATLKNDDASHLGSVATRVMARIDSESRRWRFVPWMSGMAAAALAIALYVAMPRTVERPPLVAMTPSAPVSAPIPPRLRIGSYVSQAAPYLAAAVKERSLRATPLEVRMQTDDPDVLIIWLVEGIEEQDQKGHP